MEMFLDKQVRENSPLMKYSYENFEKTCATLSKSLAGRAQESLSVRSPPI